MKTEELMYLNRENKNHRVYRPESFEKLPDSLPVTLGIPESEVIKEESIIGRAENLRIVGDRLVADIYLQEGSIWDTIDTSMMAFVPRGTGNIEEGIEITSFVPDSVNMIEKKDSAFAE